MSVDVEVAHEVSDRDLSAINRLLRQRSKSASPLDADALKRVVTREGNSLVLARAGGEIVGMLTLVTFPIATGLRPSIEGVVVDESVRGQGVGAALARAAIRLAQQPVPARMT
jgi:ribosomal protein S18 acetylase RimI-like enzyme